MEEVAQRVDRAEAVLVGVRGLSHPVCVAVSARLAVLPEAQSPAPVRDRHRCTGPSPVPASATDGGRALRFGEDRKSCRHHNTDKGGNR